MNSSALIDTRSPYQGARLTTTVSTSQTGSPSLTLFRRSLHALICSPHRVRANQRTVVIERLRMARDPMGYVNTLLEVCVTEGGPDGLDIAIDVLSNFPEHTLQYAREFWRLDKGRMEKLHDIPRHDLNDDVWYVLLRAVGTSVMGDFQKTQMLLYCAFDGPESVREASIHALGDMGGAHAIRLLRKLRNAETHASVKETIAQVLDDLEG